MALEPGAFGRQLGELARPAVPAAPLLGDVVLVLEDRRRVEAAPVALERRRCAPRELTRLGRLQDCSATSALACSLPPVSSISAVMKNRKYGNPQ